MRGIPHPAEISQQLRTAAQFGRDHHPVAVINASKIRQGMTSSMRFAYELRWRGCNEMSGIAGGSPRALEIINPCPA